MTLETRSGDCGELGESIVNMSDGVGDDCVNRGTASEDQCEVQANVVCISSGERSAMTGRVSWNEDGTHATGEVDISATMGYASCHGTYDVEYKKL